MNSCYFPLLFVGMIFASCGKKDSTTNSSSNACNMTPPDVPAAAGQLVFTLPADIDRCNVGGYIVGFKDQLKVSAASDGKYYITNVPAGEQDVIITAGSLAIGLLADRAKDRGVRLKKQKFLNGVKNEPGEIAVPKLGSLTGVAKLIGQSDHAGIDVYIPGTDMIAKTDGDGKFSISNVPVGEHNLFFEKDGYHRGQVEAITVKESEDKTVSEIALVLSTGAEGFLLIENGASTIGAREVNLTIGATSDAVLMKISEDSTFLGANWKPLVTSSSYNFSTAGQKTLYIIFANENGLQSSPYSATITVNLFATLPSLSIDNLQTTQTGLSVNLHTSTPANATGMMISANSNFNGASWLPLAETASYTLPASSYGNTTIYFKVKNADGFESPAVVKSTFIGFKDLKVGYLHSCGITKGSTVKCWGENNFGKLGNQSTTASNTGIAAPQDVIGLSGVSAIALGVDHTCALLDTSGVVCWGSNQYGQMGIAVNSGTNNANLIPVSVAGLETGVSAISAGHNHTCALLISGSVKCWGYNYHRQLGVDTNMTTFNANPTPTNVPEWQTGIVGIAAGATHTCALTNTGAAQCTTSSWTGARQITTIESSNVVALSTGGNYSTCFVTTTGGARCFGENTEGQLGLGNTISPHDSPQSVSGLSSGVLAVSTGNGFSCAVISGGQVKCWGTNSNGSLGIGSVSGVYTTPQSISIFSKIAVSIASGLHTCALTDEGRALCWGFNRMGQVGNGTASESVTTPQYVEGSAP